MARRQAGGTTPVWATDADFSWCLSPPHQIRRRHGRAGWHWRGGLQHLSSALSSRKAPPPAQSLWLLSVLCSLTLPFPASMHTAILSVSQQNVTRRGGGLKLSGSSLWLSPPTLSTRLACLSSSRKCRMRG
jgi:hypothetical protein